MTDTSQAANYRIVVEGALDPMWLESLGGLDIAEQRQLVVTHLEGRLVDQSALQGVLDTLFMLGLRLMFVERLPLASTSPGKPGSMSQGAVNADQQAE
jgi:hypothetical protein